MNYPPNDIGIAPRDLACNVLPLLQNGGVAVCDDMFMFSRSFRLFLLAGFFSLIFVPTTFSQDAAPPRKIRVSVKPDYSPLAKQLKLSGNVRVEVQIAPDGKVKKARVLGGHPVLALEAEKAALLTEFEPGPKESTQIIEFHFGS